MITTERPLGRFVHYLLLDAQERTGDWTAEFDRMLSETVRTLTTVHPVGDCDPSDECEICPAIHWFGGLADAYHRRRTEPTANITGATV